MSENILYDAINMKREARKSGIRIKHFKVYEDDIMCLYLAAIRAGWHKYTCHSGAPAYCQYSLFASIVRAGGFRIAGVPLKYIGEKPC